MFIYSLLIYKLQLVNFNNQTTKHPNNYKSSFAKSIFPYKKIILYICSRIVEKICLHQIKRAIVPTAENKETYTNIHQ